MMDIISLIAEEKIKEAIRTGEFDNLPGQGKPLQLEDLSHVPPELRASYLLLKNAGVLPEELQLKKEIIRLQDLVNCCYDEAERTVLQKRLSEKTLRFNMLMERRNPCSAALQEYRSKVCQRLENNPG